MHRRGLLADVVIKVFPSSRSHQLIVTLASLGEWHQAMDWVERAYERRPGGCFESRPWKT